jgi:hypothetical protein
MSKKYNRAKFNKAITNKHYKCLQISLWYPIYHDDGFRYYTKRNRNSKQPNKVLLISKIREYKSWKYNRKTQYIHS